MTLKNTSITFLLPLLFILTNCGGGGSSEGGTPNASSTEANTTDIGSTSDTETDQGGNDDIPADDVIVVVDDVSLEIYDPEIDLLDSEAPNSNELFVEPQFPFESQVNLNLDFMVTDENGNAAAGQVITVKSVDGSVSSWDDPLLYEGGTILVGLTSEEGSFQRDLETPDNLEKILVEINTLGIENKVLLDVSNNGHVNYHFR